VVRGTPTRADHRETGAKKSVAQVTRKPRGITPEQTEPRRSPASKSILGQSGKKGKKKRG
jgi:hypothetical protein